MTEVLDLGGTLGAPISDPDVRASSDEPVSVEAFEAVIRQAHRDLEEQLVSMIGRVLQEAKEWHQADLARATEAAEERGRSEANERHAAELARVVESLQSLMTSSPPSHPERE